MIPKRTSAVTYDKVPMALMTPYLELSPESFLLIKPSARGLRHQKNPLRRKADTTTTGKLSDRRKGMERSIESTPQRIIMGLVLPLLSERDEIMSGIIIADSWQSAMRVPDKECE